MIRQRLVFDGFQWVWVNEFVPVNNGLFFNNGSFVNPFFGGNLVGGGAQVWTGPQFAQQGAGRLFR
jgi:hypothetical protein